MFVHYKTLKISVKQIFHFLVLKIPGDPNFSERFLRSIGEIFPTFPRDRQAIGVKIFFWPYQFSVLKKPLNFIDPFPLQVERDIAEEDSVPVTSGAETI
jgi:hypothetical protein